MSGREATPEQLRIALDRKFNSLESRTHDYAENEVYAKAIGKAYQRVERATIDLHNAQREMVDAAEDLGRARERQDRFQERSLYRELLAQKAEAGQ